MQVICDIEANAIDNPTQIWVIVCKDIQTGDYHIFREVTSNAQERARFLHFAQGVDLWVGHNFLGYDYPALSKLVGLNIPCVGKTVRDTLILSKLVNYSRDGHSLEDYGVQLNFPKGVFNAWSQYSKEMEEYCVRDVDLCGLVWDRYRSLEDSWNRSIELEHEFQLIVNKLHDNGFAFDKVKAEKLLEVVTQELGKLDEDILAQFPPRLKLIREIHPKVTKHGTLSKSDFRFVRDGDLSEYNGGPFSRCEWVSFNPSSHKQLVGVLNEAGWKPTDKTKAHVETERELNRLKFNRNRSPGLDLRLKELYNTLENQRRVGWKVNENNLDTLPKEAPSSARLLAKRILFESRRRTLLEWLGLVQDDGRIHGRFQGIGAWTHRMAHQNPNTANITSEYSLDGSVKLLGKELRQLWRAPRNRLLVGVDAEGIQLRIFAHYIDDAEFTNSLVKGRKDDKSDPHSLNQRILGKSCKTRAAAKRFIYALLLGAGLGKLAEILGCSGPEAREALDRLLERYQGFAKLKAEDIPADARRGFFCGLDGRHVSIPGDTEGQRKHLCMSGYLQNGEAVVMKMAAVKWHAEMGKDCKIVNFVHDEWQTEVPNNMGKAIEVAKMQADSLRIVGEELNLKCPLAGSYWNDDHKDYTIGTNWYQTH